MTLISRAATLTVAVLAVSCQPAAEPQVQKPPQQTEADLAYQRYLVDSTACSVLDVSFEASAACVPLSRDEWELRRLERNERKDELEQARAGNTALQDQLREMEEYEAQLEPRRGAEAEQERLEEAQPDTEDAAPSGAPTKRRTRTKSKSSQRQDNRPHAMGISPEDPLGDMVPGL